MEAGGTGEGLSVTYRPVPVTTGSSDCIWAT